MQVCTSLQTDNHASTYRSVFYRPDALPATQPKASKRWRQKHWRQTTLSLYFNLESLTCWEIWSLHTWLMYLYSLCSLYNSLVKFWIVPSVLWRCWLGGRKGIRPVKNLEWSGTGMDICLERDTDMHMAQLMPLPLTVSCFSKIQIGFTFLAPADPGSPGKRAVKRACACVRACLCVWLSFEWQFYSYAQTRTHITDCSPWTTKVVSNDSQDILLSDLCNAPSVVQLPSAVRVVYVFCVHFNCANVCFQH